MEFYSTMVFLLSNQSWASGILQFDGSQSTCHIDMMENFKTTFISLKLENCPNSLLFELNSISRVTLIMFRGDYGLDILDLGINYLKKNNFLKLGAFKRSSMGNFAHYVHRLMPTTLFINHTGLIIQTIIKMKE